MSYRIKRFTATIDGLVPKPGSSTGLFLKDDGTWAAASGGGTGTVTTTGTPASGNLTKFSGATSITNGDLTGDVTTSGALATTIANNAVTTVKINNSAVTLAKIANASANSKLLGSGSSGSGAAYSEISLGSGFSMSGTTLNNAAQPKYEAVGNLPLASAFTAVSAANMSTTDGTYSLRVAWTASGVNQVQLYTKTAPSTPYDICMRLRPAMQGTNVEFGIILRNSSSGKFIILEVNTTGGMGVQEWTNPTTFSSNVIASTTNQIFNGSSPGWMRINNDGTTLTFYYSADGNMWVSLGTRTIATFLGSVDQYGFGGVPQSAGHVWISSLDAALPT